MKKKIELTHQTIWDASGVERVKLEGYFTAEELSHVLIEEWIPYFECHKCGRADYCKYTQPHKYNPNKFADIKCGVAVNTIKNLIRHTFISVDSMNPSQVQHYLDSMFYFYTFIYHAEHMIGMCINDKMLGGLQPYTQLILSSMTSLREDLTKLATSLKHIPGFYSQTKVLLVEGETEQAFLERLRESHMLPFTWLIIEAYKGQGNRRPARLQMLLDKYRREGYKVYIQGDADGRETEIFSDLIHKCHLAKNQTFLFRYDFETAIPGEILYYALQRFGELQEVPIQKFLNRHAVNTGSVNQFLRDTYNIDVNSIKIELAKMVGELLNTQWWNWSHNRDFMKSELGQFLLFIQQV